MIELEEIQNRIDEIREQESLLYKEECELRERLTKFDTDKFKEFITGKAFKASISDDYRRIYLVNTEFSIKEMSRHGVNDEYHKTFYIKQSISSSVDDGNINISSSSFNSLFEFINEFRLVVDFSSIIIIKNDLEILLRVLNIALKKADK